MNKDMRTVHLPQLPKISGCKLDPQQYSQKVLLQWLHLLERKKIPLGMELGQHEQHCNSHAGKPIEIYGIPNPISEPHGFVSK